MEYGRRQTNVQLPEKRDPHAADIGRIELYFGRIAMFSRLPLTSYFVTAQAIGQPQFVQVSVSGTIDNRVYQFDIPKNDWSDAYLAKIEAEALRRGLAPYHVNSGDMRFLDIDFSNAGEHADFARWVITEVYGLSENAEFQVTSGVH